MTGIDIEVAGIAKRYGAVDAVRDVSFTAPAGRVTGLAAVETVSVTGFTTGCAASVTVVTVPVSDWAEAGLAKSRAAPTRASTHVIRFIAPFPLEEETRHSSMELFPAPPSSATAATVPTSTTQGSELIAACGLRRRPPAVIARRRR